MMEIHAFAIRFVIIPLSTVHIIFLGRWIHIKLYTLTLFDSLREVTFVYVTFLIIISSVDHSPNTFGFIWYIGSYKDMISIFSTAFKCEFFLNLTEQIYKRLIMRLSRI